VAATAVLESTVMGMHERMVGLAGRFRHGAAALAARPGEEALVGMLQRQATKADAVRTMVEGRRRMNAKIRSCDPSSVSNLVIVLASLARLDSLYLILGIEILVKKITLQQRLQLDI
jgi:hypothetical protein